MTRPDLNHIRNLLREQKYEAVAEIEPQIINFCKWRLSCDTDLPINSVAFTFLATLESLYNAKKKDKTDPLPDYLLGLIYKLMDEYGVIKIDSCNSLQTGDLTYYCWKHKGKWHSNPVIVNEVLEETKVNIRYFHHEPSNGFEHIFKSSNFKFAIRQLSSSTETLKISNTQHFFFFYNT